MFEIGATVEQVGHGDEGGLCGEPAQRVADGKTRGSLCCGRDRGDGAGQRGRRADEERPGNDLAHTGAIGQGVGHMRKTHARQGNGRRHDENAGNGPKREATQIHLEDGRDHHSAAMNSRPSNRAQEPSLSPMAKPEPLSEMSQRIGKIADPVSPCAWSSVRMPLATV